MSPEIPLDAVRQHALAVTATALKTASTTLLPAPPFLDECNGAALDDYDFPLRVFSVFAVFFASAIAVFIPLFVQKYVHAGPQSTITTEGILVIVKQFGAGVILATAFIHLLPDAFDAFRNPCIGDISFDAWPGAIAMIGVFLTFAIENIGHRIVSDKIRRAEEQFARETAAAESDIINQSVSHDSDSLDIDADHDSVEHSAHIPKHPHHNGHSHAHGGGTQPLGTLERIFSHSETHLHSHGHTVFEIGNVANLGPELARVSASVDRLSLYVLEAGIVFHSVLIGLTLSVTQASAWTSLFIVVIFHQFFEGMALGTRIMDVKSIPLSRKYALCSWFCCVTPIGMSIGIFLYEQAGAAATASSPLGLWVMGSLNSLSAGILLWVSLVELLAEEWIHGELHEASLPLSTAASLAIVFGAILMSVLGVWA
ncbi:Zinc/iron permease [Limtongia smithiae]|uniref:Zinc/iron permease n=1 Tax=Limtongia smithiae TaxID=1125753 RepID=UPI0034CED08B